MTTQTLNPTQDLKSQAVERNETESVAGDRCNSFVYVPDHASAREVVDTVQKSRLEPELCHTVFVVNDYGKYRGYVRLARALRSAPETAVSELLEGSDIAVSESTHREAAARKLQALDLSSLPIVGARGELKGVLRFDRAMDILDEETSEDIYKKAGVGDLLHVKDMVRSEKLTQGPIGYPVGVRLMFLIVTLIGGLMVGGLIDHFEEVLASVIALAIFVPLVMDMGGNVGTQSTTIFARGLALGHIRLEGFFRHHLVRETLIGLCLAAVISVVAGTVAYFWQGAPNDLPMLGVVVGGALFFSVLTACVLGFLLPYVMLKLGVDHAPGADPFITTIKDFTGLAVYFVLAAWLLGLSV